jgi:hypothetical protein
MILLSYDSDGVPFLHGFFFFSVFIIPEFRDYERKKLSHNRLVVPSDDSLGFVRNLQDFSQLSAQFHKKLVFLSCMMLKNAIK